MFRDNIVMLRIINGFSQEKIAEKVGISRQAYAKWESGATIPDVDKAAMIAEVYGVSLDSLMRTESADGIGIVPPAHKGKNFWGTVTMGGRGQIVIPKAARDKFGIKGGDRMIAISDETGIALIPADYFESKMQELMDLISKHKNNVNDEISAWADKPEEPCR